MSTYYEHCVLGWCFETTPASSIAIIAISISIIYFIPRPITQNLHKAHTIRTLDCHDPVPDFELSKNRHGNMAFRVPSFPSDHIYNPMAWADQSITYFTRTLDCLTDQQLDAIKRIKYLDTNALWSDRLNTRDARDGLTAAQVVEILQLYNDIFFFGSIPGFTFEWMEDFESDRPFGDQTYWFQPRNISHIRLDATIWEDGRLDGKPDGRKYSRLRTLLHEALHGFFSAHACQEVDCTAYQKGILKGHGEAWQAVGAMIERYAERLLGFEVDLLLEASWKWDLEQVEEEKREEERKKAEERQKEQNRLSGHGRRLGGT